MTPAHAAAVLADWYRKSHRTLPWRTQPSPYFVWLSEIMLQQTRVEQALPYFERFVNAFPTVFDLANAAESSVFKCWEGLGYYSRARNLHQTAKTIAFENNGVFPTTYSGLLQLKGIGPYTAAAISSICFGERKGVVDGNVIRVASRFLAIQTDVTKPEVRHRISTWADACVETGDPGEINQALMELGATVCTPSKPDCVHCPLQSGCEAFRLKIQADLPVKPKKEPAPTVFEAAAVIVSPDNAVFVQNRTGSGLLSGLWKFPTIKIGGTETTAEIEQLFRRQYQSLSFAAQFPEFRHAYTHFKVRLTPLIFRCQAASQKGLTAIQYRELEALPFDKLHRNVADGFIRTFFQNHRE